MQTRTSGVNGALHLLPAALCLAGAMALAGCGGGGSNLPPAVSDAHLTTVPAPLTFAGGTATAVVKVTDPEGVDPTTVMMDATGSTGASIVGGPTVMAPQAGVVDTYAMTVSLPNNALGTAAAVYTFSVTAANKAGRALKAPVTIGTVSVPAPPAPPPAP